ncbi:MAG: hypothetical protein H6627_07135 [Calditrichae bacterium]|nr:hypothetical protein [Calditrichia bacterium]
MLKVSGEYVTVAGEKYYKISNFDHMAPFFMSVVSDSDHWMYIWSNGPLSAGRKNAENALFPYYTDDKIKDSAAITGSKTIILLEQDEKYLLWEPFSENYAGIYNTERNCYKNIYGNKLIFEEINLDLQIMFRYAWLNSEKFGFIKKSSIHNASDKNQKINILDGIQNILPHGVDRSFQNEYSTLVDAYKKCELETDTNLGIYALSSIPVDRAEPSEALKSTVVWSTGIKADSVLISSKQLPIFCQKGKVTQETDIRALRGAYFIQKEMELQTGSETVWYIVADVNKDAADIDEIKSILLADQNNHIADIIEKDIATGTENLIKTIAASDGLQQTADLLYSSRHYSNVLFNVMRGGIFSEAYMIESADFVKFLNKANRKLTNEILPFLNQLPPKISNQDLKTEVIKQGDNNLERLFYEYLPLTFSRRHGDPSRPWNRFSIDIKGSDGSKNLNYEGNWRDIFQNWEALAMSFPEFIPGMITRFVNASSADGYNPYRLNRNGTDWETLDPSDPWAYIGYWGDHQIIYLLKLLELSEKYRPGEIHELLGKNIFTYTNVPYRIKSYEEILEDPFNTVDFDFDAENEVKQKVAAGGMDGQLINNKSGAAYLVNLGEKLLVPLLVKLSNFIPEGGIWMNTQRPEWNDANNALVGNGISMVTLYYMRRHLSFLHKLFSEQKNLGFEISHEVADFLDSVNDAFARFQPVLKSTISDTDRKTVMDALGLAGSAYREIIYEKKFSGKKVTKPAESIAEFCSIALKWIDHSVKANKRDDKLFHAYNLVKKISKSAVSIRHLYEMLEGQVAVLSSGVLGPVEVVGLLDALRKSPLYREDQTTYILYPNRTLARFTDKNNIKSEAVEKSVLLKNLAEKNDSSIIIKDANGGYHFNGAFRNAGVLKNALAAITDQDVKDLVTKESSYILELYEEIFDHQSFTGRSGTFFKYEGLGSIYWHMVSKLLLAVQENYFRAVKDGAESALINRLKAHYYEIRYGIGVTKSPELYGAFPTDPYSHTPGHAGVQQPGMTGQVKEDIISRFGELGVVVENGQISFSPVLLKSDEFLTDVTDFEFITVDGKKETMPLEKGSLAFTICQVPVVYYNSADENSMEVLYQDRKIKVAGNTLSREDSHHVFSRDAKIRRLNVFINKLPDLT